MPYHLHSTLGMEDTDACWMVTRGIPQQVYPNDYSFVIYPWFTFDFLHPQLGFELKACVAVVLLSAANARCIFAEDLEGKRHFQPQVGDAVDIAKSTLTDQGFDAVFVKEDFAGRIGHLSKLLVFKV